MSELELLSQILQKLTYIEETIQYAITIFVKAGIIIAVIFVCFLLYKFLSGFYNF